MRNKTLNSILISFIIFSCNTRSFDNIKRTNEKFDIKTDLLLVQFDCKTDVDDLQTAAALNTLLTDSTFLHLNYHAVVGTYGIQEGLYVPPNDLFKLAFSNNWTDAHNNFTEATNKVKEIIKATLLRNGDIWIAEAGQSDFTANIVKIIQTELPEILTKRRIHVVQHSDWNEKSTSPEKLNFVKQNTDYQKIADGNNVGNGTPGFRSPEFTKWDTYITFPKSNQIWQLAIDLSMKYNGKEGRYNNEAIAVGGLDFSDFAEVCSILGLQDIKDTEHFFKLFAH